MVADNSGEVETPIGTLRCTLRAAKTVNKVCGSFSEAFARVQALDFDACTVVVAAGMGKSTTAVEDDVFRTGLPDLLQPLTEYLILLSNGGRQPDDEPAEGSESGKD